MLVPCLIDTGSVVSTITESCFVQNFKPWGQDRLRSCSWLQLRAANGLSIQYMGYMELYVELCGRVVPQCGVLDDIPVRQRHRHIPPSEYKVVRAHINQL